VESEIFNHYELKCDAAKREKATYEQYARRYRNSEAYFNHYKAKAEEVDLEVCETVREYKRIFRSYA